MVNGVELQRLPRLTLHLPMTPRLSMTPHLPVAPHLPVQLLLTLRCNSGAGHTVALTGGTKARVAISLIRRAWERNRSIGGVRSICRMCMGTWTSTHVVIDVRSNLNGATDLIYTVIVRALKMVKVSVDL